MLGGFFLSGECWAGPASSIPCIPDGHPPIHALGLSKGSSRQPDIVFQPLGSFSGWEDLLSFQR